MWSRCGFLGLGIFFLTEFKKYGWFEGIVNQPTLSDCGYYSFVTYTTLGFGDIIPHGPIRFLTGMEALTGPPPHYLDRFVHVFTNAAVLASRSLIRKQFLSRKFEVISFAITETKE